MRLKVLGGYEIDTLYGRPRFTHEERVEHFALSPTEGTALEQLNSTSPDIFHSAAGLFQSPSYVFCFDLREVEDDVAYTSRKGISRMLTRSIRRLPKVHGRQGAEDQRPVSPSGSARGRRDREGKSYRIR